MTENRKINLHSWSLFYSLFDLRRNKGKENRKINLHSWSLFSSPLDPRRKRRRRKGRRGRKRLRPKAANKERDLRVPKVRVTQGSRARMAHWLQDLKVSS